MKKFILLVYLFLTSTSSFSQGINRLWGVTTYDNYDNLGTLFSTDGQGQNLIYSTGFKVIRPGTGIQHAKLVEFNSKFYGLAGGGANQAGIIFEWDPVSNVYTSKFDFASENGALPQGFMLLQNGKFYGATSFGGSNNFGVLFEWNPLTGVYQVLHDMDFSDGYMPTGNLTYFNNKIYGMTYRGGSNDGGVIFEWDLTDKIFTKKYDLLDINGKNPTAGLAILNAKLYGMTSTGGTNGLGVIFEWNPASNTYIKKQDLTESKGSNPNGSLILKDQKFFGTTSLGGTNHIGVIFEWDPFSNTYVKKHDFEENGGITPLDDLTLKDSKFYGITYGGGDNYGGIFEWDPNTNIYHDKVLFSMQDAGHSSCSLTLRDGIFYGNSISGGANSHGAIFQWNPVTNVYTKKIDFAEANGRGPNGSLAFVDQKFYGVTRFGGTQNKGTIFQFDPSTKEYIKKIDLTTETGCYPYGSLTFKDGKFYGTTSQGGLHDMGVIFEWDPISNTYSKKHDFSGANGSYPQSTLIQVDGKLYGTTPNGGLSGAGTIFEWNPTTNIFLQKFDFAQNLGISPYADLTFSQGKFYGTTLLGGPNYHGVIFEWDPYTNTYVKKVDLPIANGTNYHSTLIFKDNKFYGATAIGGVQGLGSIFEWDPVTNILNNKKEFTVTADGILPTGDLTFYNDRLYGSTSKGGANGVGAIFIWDPETNLISKASDLKSSSGTFAKFGKLVSAPAAVAPGTPGSCTPFEVVINASNNSKWVPITDLNGNAVAEINANGNNLGKVDVSIFINNGAIREDSQERLYLDRNITITPTNKTLIAGTSVDIRLYLGKGEITALVNSVNSTNSTPIVADISKIALFKSSESFCNKVLASNALTIASTAASWGQDYVFSTSIQSFSTFYFVYKGSSPLPVKLISLKARLEQNTGILNWQTTQEENFSHFEIERSLNGKAFNRIGQVEPLSQQGNNNYSFTDLTVSELSVDDVYYRLKMIDLDNSYAYSSIVNLGVPFASDFASIYPNPTSNFVNIKLKKQIPISWQLFDNSGRQLTSGTNDGKEFKLDLKKYNSGTYNLKLESAEATRTIKFVKN